MRWRGGGGNGRAEVAGEVQAAKNTKRLQEPKITLSFKELSRAAERQNTTEVQRHSDSERVENRGRYSVSDD